MFKLGKLGNTSAFSVVLLAGFASTVLVTVFAGLSAGFTSSFFSTFSLFLEVQSCGSFGMANTSTVFSGVGNGFATGVTGTRLSGSTAGLCPLLLVLVVSLGLGVCTEFCVGTITGAILSAGFVDTTA